MDLDETKILAGGLSRSIPITAGLFERKHGWVGEIETLSLKEETLRGIFLRASGLVKTLEKLDAPFCFQSILAANRTLLELAVDTILLFRDEPVDAAHRMQAWESSAKLDRAEKLVEFYGSRGVPVPDQYKVSEAFIRTDKARIDGERLALGWVDKKGTPRHPQGRWTGRNLRQDAAKADELVRSNLEEIYVTEHSLLCGSVHTGLAGVRGIEEPSFLGLCGLAADSCCNLALLCARYFLIAMRYSNHEAELREVEEMREQARRSATMRILALERLRQTPPPSGA